jgi:hypothetical protein
MARGIGGVNGAVGRMGGEGLYRSHMFVLRCSRRCRANAQSTLVRATLAANIFIVSGRAGGT